MPPWTVIFAVQNFAGNSQHPHFPRFLIETASSLPRVGPQTNGHDMNVRRGLILPTNDDGKNHVIYNNRGTVREMSKKTDHTQDLVVETIYKPAVSSIVVFYDPKRCGFSPRVAQLKKWGFVFSEISLPTFFSLLFKQIHFIDTYK